MSLDTNTISLGEVLELARNLPDKGVDISDSTVTADTLGKGVIAYSADGNRLVGTMEEGIDVSDSTVTPETLSKGVVAYNASGNRITGTLDSGVFKKVGSMECGYTKNTLSITSFPWWQSVTASDIYFVPTAFTVTATGQITGGTYNINMSYSNGVITAWRDSVPGQVGIAFAMDVYIYQVGEKMSGIGKVVKVATRQPLSSAAGGVSVDVKSLIPNYAVLTADNFYLDLTYLDINATSTGSGNATVRKAYDASTGIFNFSRASIPFQGSMNNYCDVYAFVPV